jgi:hypothetical protein
MLRFGFKIGHFPIIPILLAPTDVFFSSLHIREALYGEQHSTILKVLGGSAHGLPIGISIEFKIGPADGRRERR